jgi:hypothetical protein
VTDDTGFHLDDPLAFAGIRDLQDPAGPVVHRQAEVLVALADERGGPRADAEDVLGDRRSFLEAEPRRGRPEDVAVGGWHVLRRNVAPFGAALLSMRRWYSRAGRAGRRRGVGPG